MPHCLKISMHTTQQCPFLFDHICGEATMYLCKDFWFVNDFWPNVNLFCHFQQTCCMVPHIPKLDVRKEIFLILMSLVTFLSLVLAGLNGQPKLKSIVIKSAFALHFYHQPASVSWLFSPPCVAYWTTFFPIGLSAVTTIMWIRKK